MVSFFADKSRFRNISWVVGNFTNTENIQTKNYNLWITQTVPMLERSKKKLSAVQTGKVTVLTTMPTEVE